MVQELIQPGGVEAPVAEMPQEKVATEIGEASTLQEEEATTEVRETSILQDEEATTEVRETSPLQDSPKNSSSLDLQLGKEVLMPRMFLFSPLWLMLS